jgi:hypothetical protein
MYAIGASGTGKSTLLLNLALQDINAGEGIALIDPHGDLVEEVLCRIPENRIEDVVLLDLGDEEYPVAYNVLAAHSDVQKQVLSSDLVAVFQRLSTSWGDQMTSVLGNAVSAFLESSQGGTIADLRRFLIEPEYRNQFLTTVSDPEIVYYWQRVFPLITSKPQGPLLTRLDTFLRPKLIRNMVAQQTSSLDFRAMMDQGKIFLARLSQGLIGQENSFLIGSLIVSSMYQAALGRQTVREDKRRPFYLYIDEFQNYLTPSMAQILTGARKYKLALILAHQEHRQLSNHESDIASAVIANPFTRICFRLGDIDAKKLEEGFTHFDASDLQNLGVGEAIVRFERAEHDFNLQTWAPQPIDDGVAASVRNKVLVSSRQKYSRPRWQVEAEVQRLVTTKQDGKKATPAEQFTAVERIRVPPAPPSLESSLLPNNSRPQSMHSDAPRVSGRGGEEHKYLQHLIKRLAADQGFHVTIEQQVLGGAGSVDIALQRGGYKLACEISISSTTVYELKNIQKCLAAGFDEAVVLSSNKRTLRRIRDMIEEKLEDESRARVFCLMPEEFVGFLAQKPRDVDSTETTVGGYKVKLKYKSQEKGAAMDQRQAVAKVIMQALKRLRKDKP